MNVHDLHANTILIVDDESDTLNVLVETLDQAHFTTLVAMDGASALQQVAEMAVPPDLILLDVMMPGLDGFETCRRFKANAATRDIPVLFMTALSEIHDKVNGFAAGGVDYITKPFQIEDVLARVRAHLTIRHQHRQLQEQYALIEEQRAQLAELNASKDKFFSILAQDLKSPLLGFLSFANMLEQDFDDLERNDRLNIIHHFRASAETLFALLENLLTWSSLQQGLLEYIPQHIPLDQVVVHAVMLLTPNAAQKQIRVTNMVEAFEVYADVEMVDAIIRNLLANAIKYTNPGGTVKIAATQTEDEVRIAVTDNGIGMSPEKIAQLFRIDTKTQRQGTAGEKGTGLGLILCKEFVEKNGGQIWVESAVGQGTTVTFTLLIR